MLTVLGLFWLVRFGKFPHDAIEQLRASWRLVQWQPSGYKGNVSLTFDIFCQIWIKFSNTVHPPPPKMLYRNYEFCKSHILFGCVNECPYSQHFLPDLQFGIQDVHIMLYSYLKQLIISQHNYVHLIATTLHVSDHSIRCQVCTRADLKFICECNTQHFSINTFGIRHDKINVTIKL